MRVKPIGFDHISLRLQFQICLPIKVRAFPAVARNRFIFVYFRYIYRNLYSVCIIEFVSLLESYSAQVISLRAVETELAINKNLMGYFDMFMAGMHQAIFHQMLSICCVAVLVYAILQ